MRHWLHHPSTMMKPPRFNSTGLHISFPSAWKESAKTRVTSWPDGNYMTWTNSFVFFLLLQVGVAVVIGWEVLPKSSLNPAQIFQLLLGNLQVFPSQLWDIYPVDPGSVLLSPHPVGCVWYSSNGNQPWGILVRCSNHPICLGLTNGSCGSSVSRRTSLWWWNGSSVFRQGSLFTGHPYSHSCTWTNCR